MRKEVEELWRIVEPTVRGAGLEICELQWARESGGWVLRVFLDRPDGGLPGTTPVGHKECERVSRDLSATLDVSDKIPHTYNLEVSSPGLDRPLRLERDFARFVGRTARVRLVDGVEGRRNFSGVLEGVAGGVVRIACDGRVLEFPVASVAKANLVPDWAAEMHPPKDSPADKRSA